MPTLVDYSGDDEFYNGSSLCSADMGIMLSLGRVNVYCPPRKRARISGPYIVEEGEKKPSIETLPDECLFEIFRRLPGGPERSAASCVSKRWLMLLSSVRCSEISRDGSSADDVTMAIADEVQCDGYLTRSLEGKKATDIRLAAIAVGTSSRGGLGKLSVRGGNSVRGITDGGLSAIARGCPSLRALSLWNVPYVGDEGILEIAKECQSLEKLDLCECPVSDKGLVAIAENCPNLTSLTLESCPSIGNEGLEAIGRCCGKLQSVTVKDCPLVSDQGVAGLLSSPSSVLTKVKLHALNITDFSLAVIGHYGKSITCLNLSALHNVSQKGFWVMGNARGLRNLGSLSISSCRGTTDVSLEAVGKGCPNLKQMCIRKCFFVSDHGLVAFTKAATSLESLQLEECNRITQTGILNAVSNCNKLKTLSVAKCLSVKDLPPQTPPLSPCGSLRSLSIRNCPGFGSTSLAILGELCPRLHYLDLNGLSGITDSGLLPLLNREAGLVKVNLGNCPNLTDEAVLALVRFHGQTLEVLNLDGCPKITDASVVAVADNCILLNDLDVSNCSISDSSIAALSRGVQINLQVLSLSGCLMVSDKSVPYLQKLGKSLVGLNLQRCNSLGSSAVELLVENMWRCDILS